MKTKKDFKKDFKKEIECYTGSHIDFFEKIYEDIICEYNTYFRQYKRDKQLEKLGL